MVVGQADGRTVICMINCRWAAVIVVMNNSQLNITVNRRQVAFLGHSSAREGCGCDRRSKNCLFHFASSFYELTQVIQRV